MTVSTAPAPVTDQNAPAAVDAATATLPPTLWPQGGPAPDLVVVARRRIDAGYYDDPELLDLTAGVLADVLRTHAA